MHGTMNTWVNGYRGSSILRRDHVLKIHLDDYKIRFVVHLSVTTSVTAVIKWSGLPENLIRFARQTRQDQILPDKCVRTFAKFFPVIGYSVALKFQ